MKTTQRKIETRYGGQRFLTTSWEHLDPAIPEARHHALFNYFSFTYNLYETGLDWSRKGKEHLHYAKTKAGGQSP